MIKVFELLVLSLIIFKTSCHHGTSFPSHWSLSHDSTFRAALKTSETRNMYQCERLCWLTSLCSTVTYSTSTRVCSLYTDIPNESDIIYSRTDITSSGERESDTTWSGPCRNSDCEDGTVCVTSSSDSLCLFAAVSCGTVPELPNADVMYTALTYNSSAMYMCHTGYGFQGTSSKVVCNEDGHWIGFSGACLILCGVPSNVTNAEVTYSTMTYNSIAVYKCRTGYNFQGSSAEILCTEDGLWSQLGGSCVIVSCGTPPVIHNGDVTYKTTTYTSTAVYNCHTGYNFEGTNHNAVCREDGLWTGLEAFCIIVSCGTPSVVDNANVTYTSTTYNSTAVYKCHPGYEFLGANQNAVCHGDGLWTGFDGSCNIISCGDPEELANADVTYRAMTYTSVAKYECKLGYRFQGQNKEAICDVNKQWIALNGSCEIVSCSQPEGIPNTVVTYTSVLFNSTATYSCETGYIFKGSSPSAVCDENGQWSGLSASCLIVSCGEPNMIRPANTNVTYDAMTYNSTATYTCYAGYHFPTSGSPNLTITCQLDGNWTSLSESCANIKDCSDIKSQDNGIYTISPTLGTGPIEVYCDFPEGNDNAWTVIQRRVDGSEDFNRTWVDYANGFGNLTHEFWLGNNAIYRLTYQGTYKARIDLDDFEGGHSYALYGNFHVHDENDMYKMHLSEYSGNAGDSLIPHDSMYFTTKDKDNDYSGDNCAVKHAGGWWHNKCSKSNLNGVYNGTGDFNGIIWEAWKGKAYSLRASSIKVRPV